MQKLGFILLGIGAVGVIGLIIWGIAETSSEFAEIPLIVKLVIGALAAGFLVLLAAAIRDRIKQAKTEDFKGVDK